MSTSIKAILVANIKGGSGKSTLSAALAATLFGMTTARGATVRPVWVWADRYAKSDLPERLLAHAFGSKGARRVPWLEDRGFYVCLRESLPGLTRALTDQGKLEETVFIFDSGAQLIDDAAKHFAPHAGIVLTPVNRSSAQDGLPKLIDTIEGLCRPDGKTVNPAIRARTHVVLNQIPTEEEARNALFRKQDIVDLLSAPIVRERLFAEAMPASRALQDIASIGQEIHAGTLRRVRTLTAPIVSEIVERTGWDLSWPEDMKDAAGVKARLAESARMSADLEQAINHR